MSTHTSSLTLITSPNRPEGAYKTRSFWRIFEELLLMDVQRITVKPVRQPFMTLYEGLI
ncbi:hypothetical protein IQ22_00940 [Pseudomonas duriflava]|uniref:Uncharacterized protein n=1 Tax=Pseudomonas duriflava TaxID=459528 RepID=A0A562QIC5_9PSED|nr:hypothetical protein IQ22_00940 [Pseudomonas duriflava]